MLTSAHPWEMLLEGLATCSRSDSKTDSRMDSHQDWSRQWELGLSHQPVLV